MRTDCVGELQLFIGGGICRLFCLVFCEAKQREKISDLVTSRKTLKKYRASRHSASFLVVIFRESSVGRKEPNLRNSEIALNKSGLST